MTLALVAIVGLALAFDYINGFHDAANSIATVVSTRVLSPRIAVLWAAFFNFIAFLVFQTKVASNISKGVDPAVATLTIVGAGLVGAIVWDLLTWWWGLPTSSSHALLGGLAGAAVVKAGFGALDGPFFIKTTAFIVLSPGIGLVLALLVMSSLMRFLDRVPPDGSIVHFENCSSSQPPSTRSATAATTPRRPWGSSWPLSLPRGSFSTPPREATATSRSGSCCPVTQRWPWVP